MHELRTKLGENGRVIIPSVYRKQLKLKPGAELIISIKNDELTLLSIDQLLKKAQALVKKYAHNQSLVSKLKLMREEEARNEK